MACENTNHLSECRYLLMVQLRSIIRNKNVILNRYSLIGLFLSCYAHYNIIMDVNKNVTFVIRSIAIVNH